MSASNVTEIILNKIYILKLLAFLGPEALGSLSSKLMGRTVYKVSQKNKPNFKKCLSKTWKISFIVIEK